MRLVPLALLTLISSSALAGKKSGGVDTEHANHFREVAPAPVGQPEAVQLGVSDAWARDERAKAKLLVQNHSPDFLLFDADGTELQFGDRKVAVQRAGNLLTGSNLVLLPGESGSKVISAAGIGMHHDTVIVHPGAMRRVPVDAPVVAAPDFQLPLASPTFTAGNFACSVPKRIKKETDEMKVRFECRYNGENAGLIDARNLQLRLEDGQLFANDERPDRPLLLQKGEEVKFDASWHIERRVTDMQFATMHVQFNNTFRESPHAAVRPQAVTLELDPGLTAVKNP